MSRPAELQYRKRLLIEIPNLSPAAAAALAEVGKRPAGRTLDEAVAAAVATPELQAEVLAFADAVARRFGANRAIGDAAQRSLGPGQWLDSEKRAPLSGGGLIAAYAKEGRFDPERWLRRQRERDLDEGQELGLSL